MLFTESESTSRAGMVLTIEISERSLPQRFKFLSLSSRLVFVLSVISSAVSCLEVILIVAVKMEKEALGFGCWLPDKA